MECVDWSEVAEVCQKLALVLDRNDGDYLNFGYQLDRQRFLSEHPLPHKETCWLGANYRTQPRVWAYGCDCGATEKAARRINGAR